MNSISLPCRASHVGVDRVHQAAVVVGDHQLGPTQSAVALGPQKLRPEVLGFGVLDRAPQNLTAPVGGHASGDDHGLGDHPGALACLSALTRALQYVASRNT